MVRLTALRSSHHMPANPREPSTRSRMSRASANDWAAEKCSSWKIIMSTYKIRFHGIYLQDLLNIGRELSQVGQRQRWCEIFIFRPECPLVATHEVERTPLVWECTLLACDLFPLRISHSMTEERTHRTHRYRHGHKCSQEASLNLHFLVCH